MRICVIGAGVVGVTSAYALASEGHQITLIDRLHGPGELTSKANGGQLSYSYVAPLAGPGVISNMPGWLLNSDSPLRFRPKLDLHQWRWLLSFLRACNQSTSARSTSEMLTLSALSQTTLHSWQQTLALDFDHKTNGKLIIHRDRNSFESARKLVDYQARYGSKQSVLSRNEVLALEPSLEQIGHLIAGGVFTEDDEAGDCHRFTQALFDHLRSDFDLDYRMGTTVKRLVREQGRIVSAVTDHDVIHADAFVVANGLACRELLRPLGCDVPVYGLKGYSLGIPLGESGQTPQISITDYQRRIVYARIGNTLRAAAMVDIGDETTDIRPDRMRSLARQVKETFPELEVDQGVPWAGLRPATPSGKPIVDRTPDTANLWLNIGHGALGFTLACATAVLVADKISGRPTSIEARPFELSAHR
ncbi:D-amino acid dehydrogenase [Orrella marina]|uniref:D-amino acid dehydrogenase small subunit n=1 Tax=Orrella marina TaxID=2163011 RepID=A0A2R4XLL3_9BURK|nr:D-amino acid dehydrogenase [Orrella marina]AWB34629.1 D-amino acid dehydrogenase small subunit [Orrella marina]